MKKGFTLIELLAVIVVLAILALIVTPIVINIVGNARKGANLRSMESYAKILESSYVEAKMQDPSLTKDAFLSNISSYATGYSGNRVICGSADIDESNNLSLYNCTIDGEGDYCYVDGKITEVCSSYSYAGKIIYFDVVKGKKCSLDEYKEANSTTGYNGINPNENQTSCLKFYQISSDAEKLNLLLDHNIASNVNLAMSHYYQNNISFSNALTALKKLTDSWNGILSQENYVDKSGRYVIEFSKAKARFISAEEVANIIGNKNFDAQKYNEDLTITKNNSWLFDNIESGYWTSTSSSSGRWCGGYETQMGDVSYAVYNDAWFVDNGLLSLHIHQCSDFDFNWDKKIKIGIRPVISVEY